MKPFSTLRIFLAICLLVLGMSAAPPTPARAASLTVSNCNDSGAGSLRQAVIDAVSGDTINFSVDCPATNPITLTSYIDIDKDLTISGIRHDIVLNGNNATRILLIQWGKTVTLEYLTLKNGLILDNKGGGIYDNGAYLTISHVAFDGNSATGIGADGGAIFHGNNGSLTILNSTFNGNSARYGGAIYPQVSTTVTDSAFTNNTANQGGAYTTATGGITSTFERVTMTGNTAIGPGNTYGVGGGIFLADGNLNIYNSTFSGNGSASYTVYGGAIRADHATVTIKNSTIVNNLVDENYGGGGLMINNSTLSYSNSILANNTAGDCRTDEGLTVAQNTNNLVEVSIGCGTPYQNTDPNLGPLADNGGATWTHALLSGSPAIDEGDDASCLATDQRGVARPQGSHCDIGAYEFGLSKLSPTNGATDVPLSPTLKWAALEGTTSYEYCYSSTPGPCTKWNSVGNNTSVTLSGLAPNYTYHWQVRAVNSIGSTEADGGTWWSFTTTTIPTCTWPSYTPPTTPTFGDVPMSAGHWSWVERLANSTITAGCGAGNYCPFTEVVRAQMAIFLLRGKHCGSNYTSPAVGASTGFADVPLDASYAPWVKQLAAEGITAGCGGGNFCPLQVVNRAQMAIFLLRARHGSTYSPPAVGAAAGFGDVPLDATYAAWVKQLAAEGITAGCGNGNFCPLQNVNRAQMATFLVRAFGLP